MTDAAPLPRLGEVFFDVRGNSRSMRLSWYADTGVAVFSIWQAGMCTGTFRLPIGDLRRMIEILERGPAPQGRERPNVVAARRGPDRGRGEYSPDQDEIGLLDPTGGAADYAESEYPADFGRSSRGGGREVPGQFDARGYGAPDRGADDLGAGDRGWAEYPADYRPPDYPAANGAQDYGDGRYRSADPGTADAPGGAYRSDGYQPERQLQGPDYGATGYQPADYPAGHDARGYEPAGHDARGYEPAGYGGTDYEPDRGRGGQRRGDHDDGSYSRGGYEAADYRPGSYDGGPPDYLTGEHAVTGHRDGTRQSGDPDYRGTDYGSRQDFPTGGHRRDNSGFPPDLGGQSFAETDGPPYADERFVPPYVPGGRDPYPNDNRATAGGYEHDPGDPGYPADPRPVSSAEGYPEPSWREETYSHGTDYRRR